MLGARRLLVTGLLLLRMVFLAWCFSPAQAPARQTAPKPCAEGCEERGNCNTDEGRCECPFGYGGPTCQTPLLPACRTSASATVATCSSFVPKSCACYRQCIKLFCLEPDSPDGGPQCTKMMLFLTQRCFQRPALPPEEQLSDLPARPDDAGVVWHQVTPPRVGQELVNLTQVYEPYEPYRKPRPLAACPSRCHDRGICTADTVANTTPSCSCNIGYNGTACEAINTADCWNGCSGRGACVAGFCHCKPPYFGLDCSRSKSFAPNPAAAPLRSRMRIYMYELPSHVAFKGEHDDGWFSNDPLYDAFTLFLRRFASDWTVRTEDPWEANLFYVPAFAYAYGTNTGGRPLTQHHLRRVVDYINATFPFWARHGGRDHFLWLTNDHGQCWLPAALRPAIKLVHFGYSRYNQSLYSDDDVPDKQYGCHHPLKDVVAVPPWMPEGWREQLARVHALHAALRRNAGRDANRTRLLFFSGSVRASSKLYSGGVRQAVHQLLANHSLPDVAFFDGSTPDYIHYMTTSSFCLAPYGAGWGIRLVHAVWWGCIPVIIQDGVHQPHEDLLPYERFAVRMAKREVPHMLAVLRAIPDDDVRAMRAELSRHYAAFIWPQEQGGRAYELVMRSLRLRLHNFLAEYYH